MASNRGMHHDALVAFLTVLSNPIPGNLCIESPVELHVLEQLVSWLDHENIFIRKTVSLYLQQYQDLPKSLLLLVVEKLNQQSWDRQTEATTVLQKQEHIPESILRRLETDLNNTNKFVRRASLEVLAIKSADLRSICRAVEVFLSDGDEGVEEVACETQEVVKQRVEDEGHDMNSLSEFSWLYDGDGDQSEGVLAQRATSE